MELRNKKTGEIRDVQILGNNFLIEAKDFPNDTTTIVKSLAELNEEWEDYEGPKYWYIITPNGGVQERRIEDDIHIEDCKELGNYFETKQEAEKAVEKLKAWKRLKDNGFKFEGVEKRGRHINFYQGRSYETDKQCQQAMKDLDLLFGGEDEQF